MSFLSDIGVADLLVVSLVAGTAVVGAVVVLRSSKSKKTKETESATMMPMKDMTSDIPMPMPVRNDNRAPEEGYKGKESKPILDLFTKGGLEELKPTRDSVLGVRYLDVEAVAKMDPRKVPGLLDSLAAHGDLKSRIQEQAMVCLVCNSTDLATRYLCPSCRSMDIHKQQVVEHISCGYVGAELDFPRVGGRMSCPNCKVEFRQGSPELKPKVNEVWFKCGNCSKLSRNPLIFISCRNCEAVVPSNGVTFMNLYAYSLGEYRTQPPVRAPEREAVPVPEPAQFTRAVQSAEFTKPVQLAEPTQIFQSVQPRPSVQIPQPQPSISPPPREQPLVAAIKQEAAVVKKEDDGSAALLKSLSDMLMRKGYHVESPGTMVGRTGIKHKFDLVFNKDEAKGLINIVAPGAGGGQTLGEFIVSTYDSGATYVFLVTLSEIGKSTKEVLSSNGVRVIQGTDVRKVVGDLEVLVASVRP